METYEKLEPLQINQEDNRINWCKDNLLPYMCKDFDCYIDENNKLVINGGIIVCNDFEELPVKIDIVHGSVMLDNVFTKNKGQFKSLKNMPDHIDGMFNIGLNETIESLEYGPSYVGGSYWCNGCGLTSMHGIAKYIGGSLLAFSNNIKNIDDLIGSHINDDIVFSNNPIYESFEYNKIINKIKKQQAYYIL